jgi:hypothetical protein
MGMKSAQPGCPALVKTFQRATIIRTTMAKAISVGTVPSYPLAEYSSEAALDSCSIGSRWVSIRY